MFGLDLGALGNLPALFKQVQEFSSQMSSMTDALRQQRTSGSSGGGMVEVEINGALEVLRCKIDPKLENDHELLEDLLVAAVNQAIAKAKQIHFDMLKQKTGGIPLVQEAFAKLNNLPLPDEKR